MAQPRPIKVLLVDDERDFAEIAAKRLNRRGGFDASAVFDGPSALELLARTGFDVLVLDYTMPRMNGLQVLEQVKKIAPRAQVVMLTGLEEAAVAIEGMKLGAADFLSKPVDFESLVLAIRAAGEQSARE